MKGRKRGLGRAGSPRYVGGGGGFGARIVWLTYFGLIRAPGRGLQREG